MNNYHDKQVPHITKVTLRVSSLERSIEFYQSILGLKVRQRAEEQVILGDAGHDVLTLKMANREHKFSEGLYHIAFLLPSLEDLGKWFLYASEHGFTIPGASDHIVSKAFYFNDPDGNGIEVYADTDSKKWKYSQNSVHMDTLPLDIRSLIKDVSTPAILDIPVKIGHLHLKTKNVKALQEFYQLLDFGVSLNMGHAIFMSFHHYHHHLAFNQWNHSMMSKHTEDEVDIDSFTVHYPTQDSLNKIIDRLTNQKITVFKDASGISVLDPMDVRVYLTHE